MDGEGEGEGQGKGFEILNVGKVEAENSETRKRENTSAESKGLLGLLAMLE